MSCPASPARYPPSSTPNPQPSPSSRVPNPPAFLHSASSPLSPLTTLRSSRLTPLHSHLSPASSGSPTRPSSSVSAIPASAAGTQQHPPLPVHPAARSPPQPSLPILLMSRSAFVRSPSSPLSILTTLSSLLLPPPLLPAVPDPPVFRAPRVPALRRGGVSDPPVFRAPRVPSLVRATFLTGLFRSRRLRTYRACPELPKRARVEPHPQAPKPPSPIRLRHPGVFSRDPAAPSRQGAPCQPVQSFIPSATPVRAGFKPASTAPIPTLANPPPFATSPSP